MNWVSAILLIGTYRSCGRQPRNKNRGPGRALDNLIWPYFGPIEVKASPAYRLNLEGTVGSSS